MPHNFSRKKTFTLIEMLIVIVIIGILAAALIPRLQSVQGRARDTKRKADLASIFNGVEIYKVDNGRYPVAVNGSGSCADNSICFVFSSMQATPWLSGMTTIMTSLPVDPINNSRDPWRTGNYSYAYGDVYTTTHYFDIETQLENRNDPAGCGVAQYRYGKPSNGGVGLTGCYLGVLSRQLYILSAF